MNKQTNKYTNKRHLRQESGEDTGSIARTKNSTQQHCTLPPFAVSYNQNVQRLGGYPLNLEGPAGFSETSQFNQAPNE